MQKGYEILCECLDDKPPSRPITTLSKDTIIDAEKVVKASTAKATPDPDPKKVKNDSDKGTPAGAESDTSKKKS